MADFEYVIRQYNRLHDSLKIETADLYISGYECDACPLSSKNNGHSATCSYFLMTNPEQFEEAILKWAEEHPEPLYPTWNEWQKSEFPEAGSFIRPCSFISKDELMCEGKCCDCRNQNIPEKFANKHGIKHVTGGSDG